MARLNDKVCIVTGAASGIGAKTAEVFAAEGARVFMLDCNGDRLNQLRDRLRDDGLDVYCVSANITNPAEVDAAVAKCMEVYGRIDVLANVAGVLDTGLRPIDIFTDEDLERVVAVNLKGTMYITRAVTNIFRQLGRGNVVTVASVAGTTGNGSAVYCASKGALVAMTKHTALRFAKKGPQVRANCVCPGSVWTPMTRDALAAQTEYDEITKEYMDSVSQHSCADLGICKSIDIANTLLFLASDESRCINGQVITLDFGANL